MHLVLRWATILLQGINHFQKGDESNFFKISKKKKIWERNVAVKIVASRSHQFDGRLSRQQGPPTTQSCAVHCMPFAQPHQ
jgi:hypothetical protein